MRLDDYWHGDMPYNVELLPGYGDNDPTIIRTRAFWIEHQSEWGYLGAFQEWAQNETTRSYGAWDDAHWTDLCWP